MRAVVCFVVVLLLAVTLAMSRPNTEATSTGVAGTGVDGKTNGMVDDTTHQADLAIFDAVEEIKDGLGPIYNAQSCRECHQTPISGSSSQVTEVRVGHLDTHGHFQNPEIPIAHGSEIIKGRTLVNDRAICPNGQFPDKEIQEHVPDSEKIRTLRVSLNILGDGYVEAVPDQTLLSLAAEQCRRSHHRICGSVLRVPILEAPGETAIGRFGWKDQQATLLSFAADAYVNEMGITNRLIPEEVTNVCNTVSVPNDTPGPDGLEDIDHFARFMRASKAPARDDTLADSARAKRGEEVFNRIGCAQCHVSSMKTAPAGAKLNGGTFTVPDALGDKTFYPYSDFLLHDVGTGDGIAVAVVEHYGRRAMATTWKEFNTDQYERTRNKIRTAPLWGLRLRSRLMHDGASLTVYDAINRHKGEALGALSRFSHLTRQERAELLEFLQSL